jgi:hypothetical protein
MLGACFLGIGKNLIAFDYAFGTLAISEGVLKILRLHNSSLPETADANTVKVTSIFI